MPFRRIFAEPNWLSISPQYIELIEDILVSAEGIPCVCNVKGLNCQTGLMARIDPQRSFPTLSNRRQPTACYSRVILARDQAAWIRTGTAPRRADRN